jgi:hypothetical protein
LNTDVYEPEADEFLEVNPQQIIKVRDSQKYKNNNSPPNFN